MGPARVSASGTPATDTLPGRLNMKYTQSPSRLYPRPRDIPMTLALILVAPFGFPPQPIVPALQDTPDKKEIIEERTEIAFPIRRTIPADKETKGSQPTIVELAGMGVRDKYFINAKVYAFGWYVEPKAARKALTPWIGKTPKEMSRDEKFSKAACADGFMKSLRLVFFRDVDGEDVAEAFDDSLEPRIKTAAKTMKMKDATKDLATFRAIFDAGEIKDGDEILFDLGPGGRIDTYLRGKSAGRIVSPALSWALQDVYLGMDSIEDNEEKARMIERLPETVLKPEPKEGK